MYKINKNKCTGCKVCLQNCPGATKMGVDGKAEIIDQRKLEECGGENACPFGAIEKLGVNTEPDNQAESDSKIPNQSSFSERRGSGRGLGRGLGRGSGRGLGLGPRDGRGRGLGRGRR